MFGNLKNIFLTVKKANVSNNETEKDLHLQKLTPTICDDIETYKKALDFVFNENDLLNIAITGSYGAGKSSVIETYKGSNPEKKFIHISLAYFDELFQNEEICLSNEEELINKKEIGTRLSKNETREIELEGKIINQLVHQVDPKNTPQTRFRVKGKISRIRIIKNTTLIGILAIISLYLFKFNNWNNMIKNLEKSHLKEILIITTKSKFALVSIIIGISIFLYYLYKIVKTQLQQSLIKKVKWQNNEIEIFQKDDESYFDKYLDEILYLFQNSKIDAFVFEDIDRYDNNIIFSKLREINYLVNKKVTKKKIRFFYLLKDDIFASKDRTKFFDFILPIVPVIDSSNSYNKMIEHFKNGDILNHFDNSFLERVCLYIDDMRLLKNIYNEYVIYNARIQSTELDHNKLLAIIIYKNIFPKDFSNLQLNLGYVYKIFANKDIYIEKQRKIIESRINQNSDQIEKIRNEQVNDLNELDSIYFTSGQFSYQINNQYENNFKNRAEYIKNIKENNYIVGQYNGYYRNYSTIDIKDIFDKIHDTTEYKNREKIINLKSNNKIERLEKENELLEKERNILESTMLKDLIKNENIDEIFINNFMDEGRELNEFKAIIENQYFFLIRYLIRDGKIDETYNDYLTYFYENNISREDKIFLRSITDQNPKKFEYKLKYVDKIVKHLKGSDFEKESILNFSILKYLLENQHQFLELLIEYIKDNQRFDFVWSYIVQQTEDIGGFIKILNKKWSDICLYLITNENITEEKIKKYIIYTFYYSSKEEIIKLNINSCMTTYLYNKKDFLDIDKPKIKPIINGLKYINAEFSFINYEKADKELFIEIYKNNLYSINFEMLKLILEKIYNINYSVDYITKNYTLINSKINEPVIEYVNSKINLYLDMIFSKLGDKMISDSEKSVLDIINNVDADLDKKVLYIKKLNTKISELDMVNDDEHLWEELLNNHNVKNNMHNILTYYFNYDEKIDSTLINYINSDLQDIGFDFETAQEEFGEQNIIEFVNKCIINKELINEKYEMILKDYPNAIDKFEFTGITDEKFKILVKSDIIGMTKENIKFIRSNYTSLAIMFFCRGIKKYVECMDDEILLHDEILELLAEKFVSDESKISLIDKTVENISIRNKNYSEKLQLYILKNRFDIGDLDFVIKNYQTSSPEIKAEVNKLCIANINQVYENEIILHYEILYEVMSSTGVEENYKKCILFNNLKNLSIEKIRRCLFYANFKDFDDLFEGKRPKIPVTDENTNILDYFDKKQWIYRFNKIADEPQYYRVFGKKYYGNQNESVAVDLQ